MNTLQLQKRQALTEALIESPYDARLYLLRATCYEELEYPDLAVGDGYKALLLSDEIVDDSGEYHEQARRALTSDPPFEDEDKTREDAMRIARDSYILLVKNLQKCGCSRSAYDFCLRAARAGVEDTAIQDVKRAIVEHQSSIDPNAIPERGLVRRELYPWNVYEPDRHEESKLAILNDQLATAAPKCVVKAVELPRLSGPGTNLQLGLYANADIEPGETLLREYSLLTVNNRLNDPLCDACSKEESEISCPDCDTVFCSTTCRDLAEAYHPALCGKDVDSIGRETDAKEAADALYLLLVGRAMAFSETQEMHPLELKEIRFLWGDFGETLPFSFAYNVLLPLHILEKMELDVFATIGRCDFWILNTLYAKFRGVASGRVDRTGKPEVCAVHPFWCLANHSCAPNVKWEWGGDIRLWAREGEDVVKWGGESGRSGIKKGEEILNHYCDVDLDVKARREWASGALGGDCMCERCVWEGQDGVE